jgi:hypothetical protein
MIIHTVEVLLNWFELKCNVHNLSGDFLPNFIDVNKMGFKVLDKQDFIYVKTVKWSLNLTNTEKMTKV